MPLEHNFCVVILKKHFPKSLLLIATVSSGPAHRNHSFLIQLCNGPNEVSKSFPNLIPSGTSQARHLLFSFLSTHFSWSSYRTARHLWNSMAFTDQSFKVFPQFSPWQHGQVYHYNTSKILFTSFCLSWSYCWCDKIPWPKAICGRILLLSYTSISLFIFKGSIEGS